MYKNWRCGIIARVGVNVMDWVRVNIRTRIRLHALTRVGV